MSSEEEQIIADLERLVVRNKSRPAFRQELRKLGAFEVSFDRDYGRLGIPKQGIKELNPQVVEYEAYVPKDRPSVIEMVGLMLRGLKSGAPPIVYAPVLCVVCGTPACWPSVKKHEEAPRCNDHFARGYVR